MARSARISTMKTQIAVSMRSNGLPDGGTATDALLAACVALGMCGGIGTGSGAGGSDANVTPAERSSTTSATLRSGAETVADFVTGAVSPTRIGVGFDGLAAVPGSCPRV